MASLSRTLLVVCPEGHALRVFTCVARFTGWSLGRVETIDLPSSELRPDVIAGAVRPLALRWGIPPGTEVALVLPPLVGGVLSLSGRAPLPGADLGASRARSSALSTCAWLCSVSRAPKTSVTGP